MDAHRLAALSSWLRSHNQARARQLQCELLVGGRSNYTYKLTSRHGLNWILRHPPAVSLTSAHDVGREYRVMAALQNSPVPVPGLVGIEDQNTVIGVPFYVMEYVPGVVLHDLEEAVQSMTLNQRRRAGQDSVATLGLLHDVDYTSVGLAEFSRSDSYIMRQLWRWNRQLQQSTTRDLPALVDAHAILSESVPESTEVAIIHGDFRLDNMIFGPEGRVRAVVDWELWSLGDPLADLAILAAYWSDPDDDILPLGRVATMAEGFPRRREVVHAYCNATGRNLAHFDFYLAFAYWRLAGILEGIHTRVAKRLYHDTTIPGSEELKWTVPEIAQYALHLAKKLK